MKSSIYVCQILDRMSNPFSEDS